MRCLSVESTLFSRKIFIQPFLKVSFNPFNLPVSCFHPYWSMFVPTILITSEGSSSLTRRRFENSNCRLCLFRPLALLITIAPGFKSLLFRSKLGFFLRWCSARIFEMIFLHGNRFPRLKKYEP